MPALDRREAGRTLSCPNLDHEGESYHVRPAPSSENAPTATAAVRFGPFSTGSRICYHGRMMKLDDRCVPYAEEMKTCGYCAEGEYLAAFGIKICDLPATKLYLFKEQSHRGRVIVASKLHVSEITALTDDERAAFFADVNRVANALHAVFKPAKVNYGAYGDTGHHLHFHLVPKYADDTFEWGSVFAMNPKRTFLSDADYASLIDAIQAAL